MTASAASTSPRRRSACDRRPLEPTSPCTRASAPCASTSSAKPIARRRQARLPVHVAHIKALGVDVQGQSGDIIRRIEKERAAGLDITADHYPWTASSTRFSAALVPPWAVDGGREAMLKRFDDPAVQ